MGSIKWSVNHADNNIIFCAAKFVFVADLLNVKKHFRLRFRLYRDDRQKDSNTSGKYYSQRKIKLVVRKERLVGKSCIT